MLEQCQALAAQADFVQFWGLLILGCLIGGPLLASREPVSKPYDPPP